MEILFYRYNSICEPDVLECFRKMGLTVVEETTQISRKDVTAGQTVEAVDALLKKHRFWFVSEKSDLSVPFKIVLCWIARPFWR